MNLPASDSLVSLVSKVSLLMLVWSGVALADTRIVDVSTRASLSSEELAQALFRYDTVVIGEEHYTPAVQVAEGEIIRDVSALQKDPSDFTLGWEFLNYSERERDQGLFSDLLAGKITSEQFLDLTQSHYEQAAAYAPVIEAVRSRGARLLGLNLSHAEKAPILKGGLQALDPALIPPGFEMGSQGYFDRFTEVMSGHATPEKIHRYFEAQCLTDDVMAYHLIQDSRSSRRFMIAGSFHTDFRDAAVARLMARAPGSNVVTVRIFNAENFGDLSLDQAMSEVLHDDRYGNVADYAVFVNVK